MLVKADQIVGHLIKKIAKYDEKPNKKNFMTSVASRRNLEKKVYLRQLSKKDLFWEDWKFLILWNWW